MEENNNSWSNDNGDFYLSSKNAPKIVPGFYDIEESYSKGYYFQPIEMKKEELLFFEEDQFSSVIHEIKKFWERKPLFEKYKVAHKRGIMMYGPPGTGKSSILKILLERLISEGYIAINFSSVSDFKRGMRVLRQIEPSREVIVVMEDFENIANNNHISDLLNLLDGVASFENVVYIATTNYIKKLPPRLINRPSRFDKLIYVGYPNEETKKHILLIYAKTLHLKILGLT